MRGILRRRASFPSTILHRFTSRSLLRSVTRLAAWMALTSVAHELMPQIGQCDLPAASSSHISVHRSKCSREHLQMLRKFKCGYPRIERFSRRPVSTIAEPFWITKEATRRKCPEEEPPRRLLSVIWEAAPRRLTPAVSSTVFLGSDQNKSSFVAQNKSRCPERRRQLRTKNPGTLAAGRRSEFQEDFREKKRIFSPRYVLFGIAQVGENRAPWEVVPIGSANRSEAATLSLSLRFTPL